MKKLLLLPLLIALSPASVFAEQYDAQYMVTFDSRKACREVVKMEEFVNTADESYLTCLRVFSYFNSRY